MIMTCKPNGLGYEFAGVVASKIDQEAPEIRTAGQGVSRHRSRDTTADFNKLREGEVFISLHPVTLTLKRNGDGGGQCWTTVIAVA